MNEKEAIESLLYLKEELEDDSPDMFTYTTGNIEALGIAIKALEKVVEYKVFEQRLNKVYGECDGLLEKVIEHLEKHEGIDLPEPIFKARLLTDGEVDKWEEYKKTISEQKKE